MIRSNIWFAAALAAFAMALSPAVAQSVQVKDANGNIQTIRAPNPNGRAAAASSGPVVISTEDLAAINGLFKAGQSIGNTSFGTTNGALESGGNLASIQTTNQAISTSNAAIAAATGAQADAAWSGTGSGSIIALLKVLHNDNTAVAPPNLPPAALDVTGTSPIAAATANAAYTVSPASGQSTAYFTVTGLTASGAALVIEASADGTNFVTIGGIQAGTGLSLSSVTTDGQFRVNAGGRQKLRLRVGTTGTGAITVASTLSIAPFDAPAPARDGNGDLRVPTVTVTPFFLALSAGTSTELLAASTTRIGFDVQCSSTAGAVTLSRTHATMTASLPANGGGDVLVPLATASSNPQFIPSYVSGLGVTAYTGTAQSCWGVSYARQ